MATAYQSCIRREMKGEHGSQKGIQHKLARAARECSKKHGKRH